MAKIDQVAALLAKASANGVSPEEAEALTLKAQQLMTSHGITEELLAQATGRRDKAPTIVEDEVHFTGIFQKTLYAIGSAIARANDCKPLIQVQAWKRPSRTVMFVVGFEDDVAHVKQLCELVLPQAHAAMGRYWKEKDVAHIFTKMEAFKDRREFLAGYARGLDDKLRAARSAGEQSAARAEAERAEVTIDDARASVELVLRSKEDRVVDWTDRKYGKTLRRSRVGTNQSGFHDGGRQAGYREGQRANVGQGGIGRRGELES